MFQLPLNIIKTKKVGTKLHIEGIASDTTIDRDEEKFAPSALKSMQVSIEKGGVPLRVEHSGGWHMVAGEVTNAKVSKDDKMTIKAVVDTEMSIGKDFEHTINLAEQGKRDMPGFSVAGKVNDASYIYNKELEKNIRVYNDVSIEEISLVEHPSNKNVTLDVVSFGKSVNWDSIKTDHVCLESKLGEKVRKNIEVIKGLANSLEKKIEVKKEEEETTSPFTLPSFQKEFEAISKGKNKMDLMAKFITNLQKDSNLPEQEVNLLHKSLESQISEDKSLSLTPYFLKLMKKKMNTPITLSENVILYSTKEASPEIAKMAREDTAGFIVKDINGIRDVQILDKEAFDKEIEKAKDFPEVKKEEEKKEEVKEGEKSTEEKTEKSDEEKKEETKIEEKTEEAKEVEKAGEKSIMTSVPTLREQGRNAPRQVVSKVKSDLEGISKEESKPEDYLKGILDTGAGLSAFAQKLVSLDVEKSIPEAKRIESLVEAITTSIPLLKAVSEEVEGDVSFKDVIKETSGKEVSDVNVLFAGLASYLKAFIEDSLPAYLKAYAGKYFEVDEATFNSEVEKAEEEMKKDEYKETKWTALVGLSEMTKSELANEEFDTKVETLIKAVTVKKEEEKKEEKKEEVKEEETKKSALDKVLTKIAKSDDSEKSEGGDKKTEEEKTEKSTSTVTIGFNKQFGEFSKSLDKVAGCLEKLDTKFEKTVEEQAQTTQRVEKVETFMERSGEILEKLAKAPIGRKSLAQAFHMVDKSYAPSAEDTANMDESQIFNKNCAHGYTPTEAYAASKRGQVLPNKTVEKKEEK